MTGILFTSVELGLIYALVVLGVYLTFTVLNYPDLTVDGSFVTGAAATAIAIKGGVPGVYAIFFGMLGGFLGGTITAILHTRFNISKILTGILALSMLYTINLRLMDGPNISLLNQPNVIKLLQAPVNHWKAIAFLFAVVFAMKLFVDWFLRTEFGLQLRATGDNEATAKSFAINVNFAKFVGLTISNGFVGLAGGLIAQYQGFADVNMGMGIIILGLAALMLAQALTTSVKIPIVTWAIILGAILYQLIVNVALRLGLPPTDLKFMTALIVVISLLIGSNKKYFKYGK